jgi:ParB family chromosome partitioning protein
VARKNLLASVTAAEPSRAPAESRFDYSRRGASRSMMLSIDEMAENAKKMIAGESIVSLETSLIDGSFVTDRIGDNDEDYVALRDAIRDGGQSTPILVRPHPELTGRYMIVFGHRRVRVAKELGIPVRAVVKNIEEIAHVIAQGQENTARANLSFIEKALFAKRLRDMGQGKGTIKSALTVDDTLLSRMLSVGETIPAGIIEAIGAAKSVGRDRWEELKKELSHPLKLSAAEVFISSDEFHAKGSVDRFNLLLAHVRDTTAKSRKSAPRRLQRDAWIPDDKLVAGSVVNTGKTFSLSLKSKNAGEFGHYISSNLDSLYSAFKQTKIRKESGD